MRLRTDLPTLSDGVITLRPWTGDDAAALAGAIDEEVARWMPVPWPYTLEDARAYFEGEVWPETPWPAASFAVADSVGQLLGLVSARVADETERVAEGGYWTAREARRRGVTTRALNLLVPWAYDEFDLSSFALVIALVNVASRATARSAGFVDTGERRLVPIREADLEASIWVRGRDG